MKKTATILVCLSLFFACQNGPGKAEMAASIKTLEQEIGAQPKPAPEKLIELQNALVLYADAFPEDNASVKHLVKAGEAARLLQQHDKALEIFAKIEKNYPDSKEAVGAMFMRAFTLDNDMKRLDEAKLAYEAFLKKYPNDDFADDAEFLLGNLGKSPEEIIKGFERDSTK